MPKSPRYWTRLILTFISRFKLLLIAGIGIGVVVFVFFVLLFPNLPKDILRIGIVGEYTPDSLPNSISRSISVGLTNLDKTGSPILGISDKWEVSDSGKVWTFHINNNLHWQDGSELTSKDIKYNFSDAAIMTPDKYTVTFKLKTPLSTFPTIVSKPIFKKGLLGLGEWRVTGLTLAGSYIETLTIQDKENNQRIYKFYPTEDRAKLAYELGEIDQLNDLKDSKPFDSWRVANVVKTVNTQRYVAIFFNTAGGLTGDKDFRQALNYAIDKQSFSPGDKNRRALGPIAPTSWAYNPSLKPYDLDIDHAKQLIDDAKIDPAAKKDLKIKLTTTPDLLPEAEMISKDWEKVGIKTNIQVTSYAPDDYEAFLATYDIPNDPDQYSTWHSTQTQTNLTRYKNTRIDKLLEDGRLETNEEKRKQIYFDFQRFLVEDSPAAFLYYPVYFNVSKK